MKHSTVNNYCFAKCSICVFLLFFSAHFPTVLKIFRLQPRTSISARKKQLQQHIGSNTITVPGYTTFPLYLQLLYLTLYV